MSNFSFNGVSKTYCNYLDYSSHWSTEREVLFNEVKGRVGGVLDTVNIKTRPLEVELDVNYTDTIFNRETVIDELNSWLMTDEPKPIIFERESNKIYYGMLNGTIDDTNFVGFSKLVITFICLDPYKYSVKGNKNTAISDQVTVVNSGNVDTPIIVEARALKNANYFMITQNDDDYFMIGDDDTDKPLKDYSPSILSTEMNTLSGWTKQASGSINDNYTGGTVGGTFQLSSTKNSATMLAYPEGTGWIGAAYKRSYTKAAQDFSTTVKIAVTQKKKGTARFAQYIYDTDNRLIASIGYINPNAKQKIGRIIVTLFNQNGDQVKIYDYKNNPTLYKLDDIVIYMRLTRKGNTFTVKTWKYKEITYSERIKPIDINEKTYVDRGEFYLRPVSSLSFYLGKNNGYDFMPIYILGTYNRELLPKPTGARDMIIKAGDLVYLDTASKNVIVNDEPFLHEKTFGSDFFNIDKGISELQIYPEGIFDTTVKWQDRFK